MTQLTENPIEGPLKLQPVRLRRASQTHNSFTVVVYKPLFTMPDAPPCFPNTSTGPGTYVLTTHLLNEHILVTIFQHYQVSCDLKVHMRE